MIVVEHTVYIMSRDKVFDFDWFKSCFRNSGRVA